MGPKMADSDDDDALMLSATSCELMHIDLYWSLIGSSLLVSTSVLMVKTREAFYQRRAAQLTCERLH